MFDVMRSFVDQNTKKKVKGATYTKALYRSTLAGAEILRLDKKKGNLSPGKVANFVVLDTPKKPAKENAEEYLKKIVLKHKSSRELYDTMPCAVYFNGEKV
jgi:guanine deaminase